MCACAYVHLQQISLGTLIFHNEYECVYGRVKQPPSLGRINPLLLKTYEKQRRDRKYWFIMARIHFLKEIQMRRLQNVKGGQYLYKMWWTLRSGVEAIPWRFVGVTQLMVNLPDYSKGAISNRSVRLIVYRMCGGRLCGMVRLLLSVEKLLRGAGLLVVADWTVRRALHQRH
ncbi:hypothetical protein AGLY_013190 [Aphis glycines]|uniref:Uncharacterized protein n=1 Tax=Aphis glycines TaxID=307491 RepID=A0A6G0T6X1_APHGL|nr:hypothetical protein AGLY_013190 [Aphis glycines]